MTHRERIFSVIHGEMPDVVPCWGECPMDVTVFRDIMPEMCGDPIKDLITHNEFFDNSVISPVGVGLAQETISQDNDHHIYRYETGAVWRECYNPTFSREAVSYPINDPVEALKYSMLDAGSPEKLNVDETRKTIKLLKDRGYFVEGSVIGAWYGIYYFLASFENILMWMASEPKAAHTLFDMTTEFSLKSAERLLDCGVDCIFTASDLGSGNSLLFSKSMYYEYVNPWLTELATLCHSKGAYLHLHSHGHIEDIMDGIVASGVDILNPVGPSDHNDLAMFKREWGSALTLHGGISTTISEMNHEQILDHVAEVMNIGCVGGRFIPRTESGIPPMSVEMAKYYIDTLRSEREKGYR